MKIITVKDVYSMIPGEVIVAIGREPGEEKLRVAKSRIPELARRIKQLGGYVWVSVPLNYKLAIEGPYSLLVANVDMFLYPDYICSEIGCETPLSEPEITIIKLNDKGVMLLDFESGEDVYMKIANYLVATSTEEVKIVKEVLVPISPDIFEEREKKKGKK